MYFIPIFSVLRLSLQLCSAIQNLKIFLDNFRFSLIWIEVECCRYETLGYKVKSILKWVIWGWLPRFTAMAHFSLIPLKSRITLKLACPLHMVSWHRSQVLFGEIWPPLTKVQACSYKASFYPTIISGIHVKDLQKLLIEVYKKFQHWNLSYVW